MAPAAAAHMVPPTTGESRASAICIVLHLPEEVGGAGLVTNI
jgi:hypothetical protein